MDHGRGTSFLFSNFPYDFLEVDMWKVFQRWGRVYDIFISRTVNVKLKDLVLLDFRGFRMLESWRES